MSLGVVVPAVVAGLVADVEGVGPLHDVAPTFGGFSNLTYSGVTSSGRSVVVKAASSDAKRADVRREQKVLGLLKDRGLPIPELLGTAENDQWTLNVLSFIDGTPGLRVIQSGDVTDLSKRGALLGVLLQRVHATAPRPVNDPDLDAGERLFALRPALHARVGSLDLDDGTIAVLDRSFDCPVLRKGVALIHGDSGFHNTLWSKRGRTAITGLIDWEWSGWGTPLLDLSWLWWALRFRHAPSEVWQAVTHAYGEWAIRAMDWSGPNVIALVRVQMASILLRTEPGSAAEAEWCSRIKRLTLLTVPEVD